MGPSLGGVEMVHLSAAQRLGLIAFGQRPGGSSHVQNGWRPVSRESNLNLLGPAAPRKGPGRSDSPARTGRGQPAIVGQDPEQMGSP